MAKFDASKDCGECSKNEYWSQVLSEDSIRRSKTTEDEQTEAEAEAEAEDCIEEPKFNLQIPSELEYLTWEELQGLVRQAIIFNHHKQGRRGTRVIYGRAEWRPEFWDSVEDILSWSLAKSPKRITRLDVKPPYFPVDIWRKVFSAFLVQEGIVEKEIISPTYTEAEKVRRMKVRGLYKEQNIDPLLRISKIK